jgi:hypothetical protein
MLDYVLAGLIEVELSSMEEVLKAHRYRFEKTGAFRINQQEWGRIKPGPDAAYTPRKLPYALQEASVSYLFRVFEEDKVMQNCLHLLEVWIEHKNLFLEKEDSLYLIELEHIPPVPPCKRT